MIEHYESWPIRAYCERRLTSSPPLELAAVDLARAIPDVLASPQFEWDVGPVAEGDEAIPIVVDESTMRMLLDRLRHREIPCLLAEEPWRWKFLLAIQESTIEEIQYADFALPPRTEPSLGDCETMMKLLSTMAHAFRAHVAYVEDAALSSMYSAARAGQRTLSGLPPEVLQALSAESIADLQEPVPIPGVAGRLPELLLPAEFDRERVPRAVYWINWWPATMIAAIGRETVVGAGWASISEHYDGSMTFAATVNPPDPGRPEDVRKLTELVENLALPRRTGPVRHQLTSSVMQSRPRLLPLDDRPPCWRCEASGAAARARRSGRMDRRRVETSIRGDRGDETLASGRGDGVGDGHHHPGAGDRPCRHRSRHDEHRDRHGEQQGKTRGRGGRVDAGPQECQTLEQTPDSRPIADVGRERAEIAGEAGDERPTGDDRRAEHQARERRPHDRPDEVDEVVAAEEVHDRADRDPDRGEDEQARHGTVPNHSPSDRAVRPHQRAAQREAQVAHDQQDVEQRRRDDRRLDQVRHEASGDRADDQATRGTESPASRHDGVTGEAGVVGDGGGRSRDFDDEVLSLGSFEASSLAATDRARALRRRAGRLVRVRVSTAYLRAVDTAR